MSDSESEINRGVPLSRLERFMKNRKQFYAICSGLLLLIASGLNLGWTMYRINLRTEVWEANSTTIELLLAHIGIFVGMLAGGFNAGYFIDTIGRRNVLLFAQFVFLAGAVLLAVFPTSVIGILIGRIFIGHATSLVYLTMLANCGEIASFWNRGTLTSTIQLAISFGIFIFTICNAIVTSKTNPHHLNRVIGCISILIIVLTYVCHHFLGIESPVYLLAKEKYSDASILMRDLRNEDYESRETRYEYEQMRIMVIEDSLDTSSIFKIKSFYMMVLVKFLAVFMFTQPLNYIKIALVSEHMGLWNFQPTLMMGIKVLASIIPIFSVDGHGRRVHIVWMSRLTAISLVALGIAIIFNTWAVTIIIFLIETFAGLGLSMAVDTLTTEVFSTRKKGTGLSFLLSTENVTHICLVALTLNLQMSKTFYYVTVFLSAILIWVLGILEIPETRRLTLKEARKRFHGVDVSFGL